jgi:hypothetical protein
MYATSRFGFGTTENGILMSGNSLIRGLFLMFMFPAIITRGRRWLANRSQAAQLHKSASAPEGDQLLIPTRPEELDPPSILMNDEEPAKAPPEEEDEDSTFDLFFVRGSLVVDSIVVSMTAWATQGWQVYLGKYPPCYIWYQGIES